MLHLYWVIGAAQVIFLLTALKLQIYAAVFCLLNSDVNVSTSHENAGSQLQVLRNRIKGVQKMCG